VCRSNIAPKSAALRNQVVLYRPCSCLIWSLWARQNVQFSHHSAASVTAAMNVCFRREPITHRPKPTGCPLKLPRGFAPEREALPDMLQPIIAASSYDLVIKVLEFLLCSTALEPHD
jgi:hypothetical protein